MRTILLLLIAALLLPVHTKIYQAVAMISEGARYHVNDLYDGA